MKTRTISAVVVGVFLFSCGGVWGWFYYTKHYSLPDPPFPQTQRAPRRPGVTAIVLAAPLSTVQPTVSNQPPSAPAGPPPPTFALPWDALDEFHQNTAKGLVNEFGSSFPNLQTTFGDGSGEGNNPIFVRTTLQLLDAFNTATPDKKPALLLAADIEATHLWCNSNDSSPEPKSTCPDLEANLAKYGLALHFDEMGGGFFYRRDLLWRVWENYPESPSGEQAFVLLLEDGWDTTGACNNGGDQTREVIRRGEEFLQKHPASPYRAAVTYLIAEAYASWWSLSKINPNSPLAEYVDPKQYEDSADAARLKAIEYLEKLPALAPGTKFEKYAQAAVESLRDKEILKEPRFFCAGD